MKKPIIGITMGDPRGIGPEITLKAIFSSHFKDDIIFLIIGSQDVLLHVAKKCKIPIKIDRIREDSPLLCSFNTKNDLFVVNAESAIENLKLSYITPQAILLSLNNFHIRSNLECMPMAIAGQACIEYIFKGIDLAMNGTIDALVTAPINKEAIKLGGFDYPGHTELLKERTNTKEVVMLMVGDNLKVSFVTSHIAYKSVPSVINIDNIVSTITITAEWLKRFFSVEDPRVAVCGLNPHSGEAGRFGLEEETIIIPAIKRAEELGITCFGPVPADVVFFQARKGLFDVVIALYHDQGAIPIKLLAFESGVNITIGIPIIRTSPDHGTAYDIAEKGVANPGSMIEAINCAIKMSNRKLG